MDNEKEKIEKESTELVVKSQNLVITNQGQYEDAASFLQILKGMQKKVENSFNSIIEKAHQAHKEAIAKRDEHLDPLKKAEKTVKNLMVNYTEEQERKAREEQLRLQKIADAEAARQKKILEEKIARAEASGKTEKAEELQAQKETITPIVAPVIAPQIETPKGVSYREQWSAEIIDEKLIPREYLIVNLQALNKIAAATKGTISVPGVRFVSTKILASR